jgi:hypothetical protein
MKRRYGGLLLFIVLLTGCQVSDTKPGFNPHPMDSGDSAPPYHRDAFGGWVKAHGNCDTREFILERDSAERAIDTDHDGCADDGMLIDVYTGNLIRAKDAQIDHVYPVKAVWNAGGWNWPPAKRRLFYNDVGNLRAVFGTSNEAKSDRMPAHYRPPSRSGWCAYSTVFEATAHRWELPISAADSAALAEMKTTCGDPGN